MRYNPFGADATTTDRGLHPRRENKKLSEHRKSSTQNYNCITGYIIFTFMIQCHLVKNIMYGNLISNGL